MLFERLKQNTRLLEQLSVFSCSHDEIPGLVPNTAEYLFVSVLKQLQRGELPAAKQQYQQLCDLLGVAWGEGDDQLEPLRTLLHLKLWDGGAQDRHQLQQFLVKQLGLHFEAEPAVQPTPVGSDAGAPPIAAAAQAEEDVQQPASQQLPSHLTDAQYSTAAFKALLGPAATSTACGTRLTSVFDQSCLWDVIADESLPLQERVLLLQVGEVPPAVLPVQLLVGLVQAWSSTQSWNNTPATDWVTANWGFFTAEQALALRPVLPDPGFGFNPKVDRPYAAALVTKALAGPAAADGFGSAPDAGARAGGAVGGSSAGASAADAGAGSGADGSAGAGDAGRGVVPPWSCRAADAAAAVALERVLQVCNQLGPPADWVKLHALHARVQLQLNSKPCVDVQLLVAFLQLLGRATWSTGPTVTDNRHGGTALAGSSGEQQQQLFGSAGEQQQPLHVACSVCDMRPIVGPRLRSRTQCGFNVCVRCAGSQEAAAAAPLEEVKHDDSIYMLPVEPLPDVLRQLPASEQEREALARQMLLELVQDTAYGGLFTPQGPCPLAAAGLLLPAAWRDAAVAEAQLLSGRGDTAAWSRIYQKHADVAALAARTELSFAQHNRSSYAVDEEVNLHLDTKNTGPQGVLVKVYAINAWNYYTSEGRQVDLDLELSGLAPSQTLALQTPQNPVIRTRHVLPLPGLSGTPGVWLVEAVANGHVVRARIQKGSLRMTQRPSVAGQVLTVLGEDWQPVESVRVWCQGKEYTASSSGQRHEVLLPYARQQEEVPLVLAARLAGAPDPGRECVALFADFERLAEQYSLKAQLFCHQESLLPGQTVPVLLQLALQLHGVAAPLQLLQEVTLTLTATSQQGADMTQVFKELAVDPVSCQLQLPYSLPQGATRLAAQLTAKLLLMLPGTNGEPAWQEFELTSILPGQQGQQPSIEVNSMAASSAIWDVYLTVTTSTTTGAAATTVGSSSSSSSTSSGTAGSLAGAPEYVLQVLGRSGEAPAVPKTLSVWLNHVAFNSSHQLRFRVQTGPCGTVKIGRLSRIRQIRAQIEAGVSHGQCGGSAAVGVQRGLPAAGFSGGDDASKGPMRNWQVARASWWQGGLQHEYTMPAGGTLELPIRPAAGQSLTAKLLQLADSGTKSSSSWGCPGAPAVAADISSRHLQVSPVARAAEMTADSSSAGPLGSAEVTTFKVQGLAAGMYRLVVPALLLEPPEQGFVETGWSSSEQNSTISIRVLPSTAASGTVAAAAAGGSVEAATLDSEAANDTTASAAVEQAAWLWSSTIGRMPGPAVVQPSPSKQLHVSSVSCTAAEGLSVQVSGTAEQLAAVQLVAVFSRFLPDGSITAAQLLHNALPWGGPPSGLHGFGFGLGLRTQAECFEVGICNEAGLGFGASPQPCGEYGRCSYSSAAKLDSAVAYVLQRRQWEAAAAASGLQRPGSLLARPSLLMMPRRVRIAASATSVLRGGDGGRVQEKARSKAARPFHSPKKMAGGFGAGGPMPVPQACYAAAACAPMPYAYDAMHAPTAEMAYDKRLQYEGQVLHAQTPVLGFLKNPAVVLAGLIPTQEGSLVLPAEQLQQLLADSAAAAGPEGSTGGGDGDTTSSSSSSSSSSMLGRGGFAVVHVAAFVLQQPGQFASCIAAVEGAAPPEAAAQPAARRDMGLQADVDEDAVCALACDVIPLLPADTLTLPNAAAAEAAVYGTSQQLYALLSGLLDLAETGGAEGLTASWSDAAGAGALRRLLPRPVVPPKAGGSSCRALLRLWEPLLLCWHELSTAARQELVDKLGSAEMAFYLACRDKPAYEQLVLPLLQAKLPSELCCLEQVLLLQATHNQPPVPAAAASAPPVSAAETGSYEAAKLALLQYWCQLHRYQRLTVLEQLLLAALEGRAALLRFAADMRQGLETAEQKRGVKKTWMTVDRRALFDFALLVHRQLEQQEQQRERQQRQRDADASGDEADSAGSGYGDDADTDGCAGSDDFVHVAPVDDMGGSWEAPHSLPAPGMRMAAVACAGAPVPQAAMVPKAARRACGMTYAADLAARQQLAAAAVGAAHLAPKETQEWAEAGWWRCEGQHAPAALIPPALFWADFATHWATTPEQPFIATDPAGAAASTASITAALAVVGLPCEGAPTASAGSTAAGARSIGCSRSCAGSTLTLTATSACLLWVKQVKAVASISATAAAQASASSADAAAAAPEPAVVMRSSASSVLVAERLFDPRFAQTNDPETGEQLLLSLHPSEQQPLLAGQAYCHSVVVTSTGPFEQQLDILLQLPQGALPLAGSPATTSISISLAPYATKQLTTTFYFPQPGLFKCAPVAVIKRGRPAWLPASAPAPLIVAALPPAAAAAAATAQGSATAPEFNWSRFLATSSPSQILQCLQTGDLSCARLADLSPYCRDAAFFDAAVSALSERHVFEFEVWKWAVPHMHGDALRQLLPLTGLGKRAASYGVVLPGLSLLPLTAADVGLRHLEYWPWVNPYCRPIPRGDGGDASLPSVLQDNPNIAAQWRSFLLAALFDPRDTTSSSSSSGLGLARAAAAACHLLLQDRVDDAAAVLAGAGVEAAAAGLQEGDPLRMQVDYLRAWMALVQPLPTTEAAAATAFTGASQQLDAALSIAQAVVLRYADVAAQPWRKRFAQLSSMVLEVEQQLAADPGSSTPALTTAASAAAHGEAAVGAAAAAGPMLSVLSLEGSTLKLLHSGIRQMTLSAYHIDTELLFTSQPFSSLSAADSASSGIAGGGAAAPGAAFAGHNASSGLGKVAFMQPTARVVVQLPELGTAAAAAVLGAGGEGGVAGRAAAAAGGAGECCVLDVDALMPQLASQSVLLEVEGGGVTRTLPRFASKLSVQVFESQGVLQACSSSADHRRVPAAAVYVKVFARDSSGDAWFYKDGYTDLRGKFDYVTLTSTADMSRVTRYSLLAASPGLGSFMVQAAPPAK